MTYCSKHRQIKSRHAYTELKIGISAAGRLEPQEKPVYELLVSVCTTHDGQLAGLAILLKVAGNFFPA
jgi:hypothetical protein